MEFYTGLEEVDNIVPPMKSGTFNMLYSRPGLGRTLVLEKILWESPEIARVAMVSGPQRIAETGQQMLPESVDLFDNLPTLSMVRNFDLLLIDDLDFLCDRCGLSSVEEDLQEFLFHYVCIVATTSSRLPSHSCCDGGRFPRGTYRLAFMAHSILCIETDNDRDYRRLTCSKHREINPQLVDIRFRLSGDLDGRSLMIGSDRNYQVSPTLEEEFFGR